MAIVASSNGHQPPRGLFEVARRAGNLAPASLARLASVLSAPADTRRRSGGVSDLNWNGSPWQVLVSCGAAGTRARLIVDPAHDEGDAIARLDASLRAMEELLVEGHAAELRDACWRMLRETLPYGEDELSRYPTGMLRLAAALGAPGVAVYAGARHDGDLAWQRAACWLDQELADPREARALVASLAGCCRLFGTAVEGTRSATARRKLYWRLAPGAQREVLGVPLLGEPPMLAFLADVMRDRAFPLTALTFSASFAPASGALEDVKVDACNHSAILEPHEIARLAERHVGLDAPGAARLLALLDEASGDGVAIGCVGFGLDRRGGRRFNVYLFPAQPAS